MLPDPIDIIWQAADSIEPVFATEDMAGVPEQALAWLKELGILRPASTATHVVCDACDEHHVERIVQIRYQVGQTRFYIPCPENGRVEVPRERLFQWAVDFSPILNSLAMALSTQGQLAEVVPSRVWNLGRAALAGKSKTIWVARGLFWPDASQIALSLPKGRSAVLFYLGHAVDDGLLGLRGKNSQHRQAVHQRSNGTIIGIFLLAPTHTAPQNGDRRLARA